MQLPAIHQKAATIWFDSNGLKVVNLAGRLDMSSKRLSISQLRSLAGKKRLGKALLRKTLSARHLILSYNHMGI